MSYLRHSLGEFYNSPVKQLVFSTAPPDWAPTQEGWRMHWPKCSDQNNQDKDTSLNNSWNNENTSFWNITQYKNGWRMNWLKCSDQNKDQDTIWKCNGYSFIYLCVTVFTARILHFHLRQRCQYGNKRWHFFYGWLPYNKMEPIVNVGSLSSKKLCKNNNSWRKPSKKKKRLSLMWHVRCEEETIQQAHKTKY